MQATNNSQLLRSATQESVITLVGLSNETLMHPLAIQLPCTSPLLARSQYYRSCPDVPYVLVKITDALLTLSSIHLFARVRHLGAENILAAGGHSPWPCPNSNRRGMWFLIVVITV